MAIRAKMWCTLLCALLKPCIMHACKLNYACRSPSLVLSDGNTSKWDHEAFSRWLQCYMQPGMNSAKDHQGRRIWYQVSELYCEITCINSCLFFLQSKPHAGGASFSIIISFDLHMHTMYVYRKKEKP